MGEVTVSSERVRASSELARNKASEMEGGINSFVSQVDGFLSGGWQGQASEAYRPPFEDWAKNAKKVQQALSAMAELLGSSAEEYDHREDSNDALVKSVHVEQPRLNF